MIASVKTAHPTVLCVDDDNLALALRKQVLEGAGFLVVTAFTAKQAFEILSSRRVDIVVTDHLLGTNSATTLACELRKRSKTLPILVVTGSAYIPLDNPPDYGLHKLDGPLELISKVRMMLPSLQS